MIGDDLTAILILAYIVLAVLYGCERDLGKCLYFAGAAILTTGVLLL